MVNDWIDSKCLINMNYLFDVFNQMEAIDGIDGGIWKVVIEIGQ